MEAFTDGNGKTNIKTYFEGEILDFNKHSFKTLSFNSSLHDDANNWRKLDPFVRLSNSELVRSLTSRNYMMDLNAKWLFLRIKGMDGPLRAWVGNVAMGLRRNRTLLPKPRP
jgi:hypothetical protein